MKKAGLRLAVMAAVATALAVAACEDNTPPPLSHGGGDASNDAAVLDGAGDAQASDGAHEGSGPCTLAKPPSDPDCASCLQAQCCEGANACLGDPDCGGYLACARACPSALDASTGDGAVAVDGGGEGSGFACFKGCEKQFPNGVNAGIVLLDCEQNACAGKCQ